MEMTTTVINKKKGIENGSWFTGVVFGGNFKNGITESPLRITPARGVASKRIAVDDNKNNFFFIIVKSELLTFPEYII